MGGQTTAKIMTMELYVGPYFGPITTAPLLTSLPLDSGNHCHHSKTNSRMPPCFFVPLPQSQSPRQEHGRLSFGQIPVP